MSSGLYSDNVKNFIEAYIEIIEAGNLTKVLIRAHEELDMYECNVVTDILEKADIDLEAAKKNALSYFISKNLMNLKNQKLDNISIPAFIHSFIFSTFNIPEKDVVEFILENKENWSNHIKWDPSLKQWRVFA